MTSQLAVISARAHRLHRLLSQAGEATASSQAGKIMKEAAEVAQADLAGDTADLIHELADVIIAASQCALAVTPDGLDLLWDELADTLAADCRRSWRDYGGVIRHSAPWSDDEIEAAAETAITSLSPDPDTPGVADATVCAAIPGSLPGKLRGMDPSVMRTFAEGLLAHSRFAPPAGRHATIADVTVEDGTITIRGTLTACEGADQPGEVSW